MAQPANTLSWSPNPSAGPPRSQLKTPAHTLARVRNNQRRHRERRREYIASLEQKLQETERLLAQATAELATSKLELQRWRDGAINETPYRNQEPSYDIVLDDALSSITGDFAANANSDPVERFIGTQETLCDALLLDSSPTTPIITPSISERPLLTNILPSASGRSLAWNFSQSQHSLNHVPPCYAPSCCELVEDSSILVISEDITQPESDPELRKILLPPAPSFYSVSPPSNTESTTLCSQAFVLISQQNFRGVDAHTIRGWLYQGFRQAKNENEGCRVDNKLLFGLLDFISSP
ncbi:hypothetical protein AOQ84DRAFT_431016 [Glonium stellatum]|uniref:BZIP domain-containing protein n=1 Tax=Glonium stellatum TaxID=574774 RepID=A0A8E2JUV6_9PEZI|nr:hypothetical protein AOQ84DRAFT_431016 [Glonium stellatum]